MIIIESFVITADDADVLKAPSRLASIPEEGTLALEVSCTKSEAANHAELTVTLPDGENPVEGVRIPANGYNDGDDVLHDDTEFSLQFPAFQGGHFGVQVDVTGTVSVIVMATLVF